MGRNLPVSLIFTDLARFYRHCQVPYRLQKKRLWVFNKISLYHFPFYDVYCVCFDAFKLVIALCLIVSFICGCHVNLTISNQLLFDKNIARLRFKVFKKSVK